MGRSRMERNWYVWATRLIHLRSFEKLIDGLIEYNDVCKCSICRINLCENRLKCQYTFHIGFCTRTGTDIAHMLSGISCPNFNLCRTCKSFRCYHANTCKADKRSFAWKATAMRRKYIPPTLSWLCRTRNQIYLLLLQRPSPLNRFHDRSCLPSVSNVST